MKLPDYKAFPVLLALAFSINCQFVNGLDKNFLIVAKSVKDINFINFSRGAGDEAEKSGDRILFTGSRGDAHFREQDEAVSAAIEQELHCVALSVLNEEYLLTHSLVELRAKGIPLITFDSDFSEKNRDKRIAFVGMDNEAFGYQMGVLARDFFPGGGTLAIIGEDRNVPNINARIDGIRKALNGDQATELRLNGEYGWTEHPRTPWYCHDDYERALNQLLASLRDESIDVIISAGWWPQMSPHYRETVLPYKDDLVSGRKLIICASDTREQQGFNREGLSSFNVGVDFHQMGRKAYLKMRAIADGESVPEYSFIDLVIHSCFDIQDSVP